MSKHRSSVLSVLLSLALVVGGCADDDPSVTPPGGDDAGVEDPAGPPAGEEDSPLGVVTGRAVQLAAEDAGVDPSEVEVVRAEEVTWRSGAIGCPQPGEVYTQALVEGFRVVVEVEGERIHYHADDPQEPFRCDDPEEPLEAS